ncbi:hypothetical protein G7059_10360 [Erysipelothrix sp. HDW6A]|uniref:hypothetical protein n=1 Tax=Erysipelothrix sp. HDW6A TaxID=2714928 RepID=UPI0014075215|nr:hypothetical protein [Erysipelothrix sp. HDW6A]QIK58218.1 hypothetical protein G7059_10360 [Erysipelothrix sp. HDW6A]
MKKFVVFSLILTLLFTLSPLPISAEENNKPDTIVEVNGDTEITYLITTNGDKEWLSEKRVSEMCGYTDDDYDVQEISPRYSGYWIIVCRGNVDYKLNYPLIDSLIAIYGFATAFASANIPTMAISAYRFYEVNKPERVFGVEYAQVKSQPIDVLKREKRNEYVWHSNSSRNNVVGREFSYGYVKADGPWKCPAGYVDLQ